MAQKTNIEWTDYNWNFIRGCSRVSEGCRHCYAETIAHRFSGEGQPYEGLTVIGSDGPRWNGKITFHEDILLQPLRWKKPRKVFVNSMSDLFHENVSDEILDKAFAVMALTPQHTYQILTKRPERMREYISGINAEIKCIPALETHSHLTLCHICGERQYQSPEFSDSKVYCGKCGHQTSPLRKWPLTNVWLGVSVEDQKTADDRIAILLETPAACHWISAEPLLSEINLRYWLSNFFRDASPTPWSNRVLDWVIVGGESGPGARPFSIEWAREIIHDCKGAQCPVFIKQLGSEPYRESDNGKPFLSLTDRKGGNIAEFPKDLRVRQYPEVKV